MKSSTLPLLRVEPDLREAVEEALIDGETVSGFIEASVRGEVERRRIRADFLRRGLVAWTNFERSGESTPAEVVHRKLEARLARARGRT